MTEALKVLIIEDDPDVALGCEQALLLEGIAAECAGSAEQARKKLGRDFCGIVVSDIRLPKMDGMTFLREMLAVDPELPVVLITGHGDVTMAVQAMKDGAYDFIQKPFPPEHLVEVVRRALEKRRLVLAVRDLRRQLEQRDLLESRLIGCAPGMQQLRDRLSGLAGSAADVLIYGETGTGKELLAHAIDATLTPPPDTEVAVIDVTDGKPLPNRAIVEAHSDPAPSLGSRAVRITAEVANFSDVPVKELPVTLLVDGKPVAKGLVDLPPRGHAIKRFVHILQPPPGAEFTPGAAEPAPSPATSASGQTGLHHISVALQGDALAEDDERHLRVEVQRHLRVLVLDGDARTLRRDDEAFYLEMALRPGDRDDAPFAITTQPLDEGVAALGDFDAVFLCNAKASDIGRKGLDKALRQYVLDGGGLFITLGDNTEVDAFNTTLHELLPQALAVVKTTGPLRRAGQAAEAAVPGESESALTGPGTAEVTAANTLQIASDCGPRCTCDYMVRTYAGLRRMVQAPHHDTLDDPTKLPPPKWHPEARASMPQKYATVLAAKGPQPDWHKYAWSCHVSYPRNKLFEVGGFWEAFRGAGFEDLEIGLRMTRAGVTLQPFAEAGLRLLIEDRDRTARALVEHHQAQRVRPDIDDGSAPGLGRPGGGGSLAAGLYRDQR